MSKYNICVADNFHIDKRRMRKWLGWMAIYAVFCRVDFVEEGDGGVRGIGDLELGLSELCSVIS